MKARVPSISWVAAVLLCASAPTFGMQRLGCSAVSGVHALPLVELYTSEGCDSCPPADRWLRTSFPPDDAATAAAVLAFHVDYWDALGWRDRFADPAYTQRQQAMVRMAGARTAYTPQLLVQGRDRGLWRNAAVTKALRDEARESARARIALDLRSEPARIVVDVRAMVANPTADAVLYVAMTESNLSSAVTAGENAGARLVHDHVVRAFVAGPAFDAHGNAKGSVTIALPRERGQHPVVVAFVQHRSSGEILQSLSLPVCP